MVFLSYQVEREIVTKKHRRQDGIKLPAFASGLADTNLSSTGLGVLKPTPIMTPEVVQTNDNIRKSSNDSSSAEEKIVEDYKDILGDPTDENSNSTVKVSTEISKSSHPSSGPSDLDGLNNEATQVRISSEKKM